ncbi:MAG: cell envelope integrity protein TolA [bacterium]
MAGSTMGSFLEHRGGFVASLVVHAVVLFLLLAQRVEPMLNEPKPMKVFLRVLPVATPTLTPSPPVQEQPVLPEQNRATEGTKLPTNVPVSVDQPTMSPQPESTPQPEEAAARDEAMVEAELARQKKSLEVKRLELAQTHKELREQIQSQWSQEERSAGPKTEGSLRGAVRTLELKDQPEEVVNKVLQRYKIKIFVQYVDRPDSYNFLNSASTQHETYYRRAGSGLSEVFQISPEAVAKMASLETEEIRRRGLDPQKTRVVETVFGIVQVGSDYDLGVLRMQVEPLL